MEDSLDTSSFGSSQSDLFPELAVRARTTATDGRRGTFADNMKLPIHRWFRYSAGFSAEWAQSVISEAGGSGCHVLDPFAGSGTTLLAARAIGATSVGLEAHPFVTRIAHAKLILSVRPSELWASAENMLEIASALTDIPVNDNLLLQKCYEPVALAELERLKQSYFDVKCNEEEREILWLALTSILRETSHAGTAQWQYVLPKKSKSRVKMPFEAFRRKMMTICADLQQVQTGPNSQADIVAADARNYSLLPTDPKFDLIVTSPPYPNNYDYADATRLEMSFWGEVEKWGDLHSAVREKLLCSCSQHSAAEKFQLDDILVDPLLAPISEELSQVCHELAEIRETKGGKKTYHTMVAAYFLGLAQVWHSMRGVLKGGGTAHFVIGDSAPYGVYVPSDKWLGALALSSGFKSHSFEKLRDRNIKWKNRKHTVPLKEGILRVEG